MLTEKQADWLLREMKEFSEWFLREFEYTLALDQVSPAQYGFLSALLEKKGKMGGQLAKLMNRNASQASRALGESVSRGWVRYDLGNKDRRAKPIEVLEPGQDVFARCKHHLCQLADCVVEGMEEEARKRVLQTFGELNRVRQLWGRPWIDAQAETEAAGAASAAEAAVPQDRERRGESGWSGHDRSNRLKLGITNFTHPSLSDDLYAAMDTLGLRPYTMTPLPTPKKCLIPG